MKLLQCYIENFGALSKRDFTFSDGINDFCEENGFGKSTLAAFIKAMFYGLPAFTKRSGFNDRKHYYPFGGGRFGGSLTFSMEGHTYRIERFFDKASVPADELTVYRDHATTTEFDKYEGEIGRAVFGLDRDSFERTIFINSDDIDISATEGVSAKLHRLVNATDEASAYSDALSRIEEARKRLKASRGTNDELSRVKTEITRLESEVRNLSEISDNLSAKYELLAYKKQEVEEHASRYHRANTAVALEAKWVVHDEMDARVMACIREIDALHERFPGGLPTEEEITILGDVARAHDTAVAELTRTTFTEDDAARLAVLEDTFRDGVPTEEALAALDENFDRYTRVTGELSRTETAEEEQDHARLARHFADGCPTEDALAEEDAKLRRLTELGTALTAAPRAESTEKRLSLPSLLIAVLSLGVGIGGGVIIGSALTLGIILLAVGVVGLCIGTCLTLLSLRKTNTVPTTHNNEKVAEQAHLREQLLRFLAAYHYEVEMGVEADYMRLKRDCEVYRTLCAAREKRAAAAVLQGELSASITATLTTYGIHAEFRDGIRALRANLADYTRLTQMRAKQVSEQARVSDQIRSARTVMENILSQYGISPAREAVGQVTDLKQTKITLARLEHDRDELLEKTEAYREEHGLTERPDPRDGHADLEDLKECVSLAQGRYARYLTEIEADEALIEPLEARRAELESAKEALERIKTRIRLLDAAGDALKTAEKTLTETYIKPVKDAFLQYAAPIEAALGERVNMDGDFRLTFERNGEMRSDRHLSAGQRSICALCFRLALIDHMYREQSPFIIMDDPFVYLDEPHLARTLALVRELSGGKQILYFTCYPGRRAVSLPTDARID